MSTLSTQVDKLRELAARYDELQVGVVKAVTVPSDMGSVLRNAADTIWELRGSVHRERAEADRLREEFNKMDVWHSKELSAAMAENAKLRTFIDLKQTCWKYVGWCSECPHNGLDDEHDDCNCTVREKVNSLARELGIEVN